MGVIMKHILIVDDSKLNLKIAEDALKEYYEVSLVLSGFEALECLKEKPVDLILLDIEMPEMNGIETMQKMQEDDMISNIPVMFLTSITDRDVEAKCLTLGAQDFITKPFYKPAMLRRVQRVLELADLRADLEQQVLAKTEELESLTIQTITTFANAIDAKDDYTKGHSLRVAQYSKLIAQKLGWGELGIRNLFYTALLHDIGKIGIPDYILNKSDKLIVSEYDIIKKHPEIGGRILEDVLVVPYLGVGAYSHHERYDGKGYPHHSKGEEIPLIGRIIAVADAVDAMLSKRAYRDKMRLEDVISELQKYKGTQFDPILADVMINILESGIVEEASEVLISDSNVLLMQVINNYVNFSKIDGLTGLWNRIYLEEKIESRMKDKEAKSAFLMIDLDNFKSVNDTWGHIAGDSLLSNIAVVIQSILTPADVASRMGGDEFGIYISKISGIDQVREMVVRLMHKIVERMKEIESPMKVTASIGIAISPNDGINYQTLYHNADKALYHAKNSGKNDYCFFGDISRDNLGKQLLENKINLKLLKEILEEKKLPKGVYTVNQKEFEKIYQLMQRISKRSNEEIQIILFTLLTDTGEIPSAFELAEGYQRLVSIAKESLRIGDVATRFSDYQYVILFKGKKDAVSIVVDRIENCYNSDRNKGDIKLYYELERLK